MAEQPSLFNPFDRENDPRADRALRAAIDEASGRTTLGGGILPAVLWVARTVTLYSSATIPPWMTLEFAPGARLVLESSVGMVLRVEGPMGAGYEPRFELRGEATVDLAGPLDAIVADWWAASGRASPVEFALATHWRRWANGHTVVPILLHSTYELSGPLLLAPPPGQGRGDVVLRGVWRGPGDEPTFVRLPSAGDRFAMLAATDGAVLTLENVCVDTRGTPPTTSERPDVYAALRLADDIDGTVLRDCGFVFDELGVEVAFRRAGYVDGRDLRVLGADDKLVPYPFPERQPPPPQPFPPGPFPGEVKLDALSTKLLAEAATSKRLLAEWKSQTLLTALSTDWTAPPADLGTLPAASATGFEEAHGWVVRDPTADLEGLVRESPRLLVERCWFRADIEEPSRAPALAAVWVHLGAPTELGVRDCLFGGSAEAMISDVGGELEVVGCAFDNVTPGGAAAPCVDLALRDLPPSPSRDAWASAVRSRRPADTTLTVTHCASSSARFLDARAAFTPNGGEVGSAQLTNVLHDATGSDLVAIAWAATFGARSLLLQGCELAGAVQTVDASGQLAAPSAAAERVVDLGTTRASFAPGGSVVAPRVVQQPMP